MKHKHLWGALLPIALIATVPAQAALTLTAAGIADGFTLSTFATTNPGNTGCCVGPFGVAVATNGNIIVSTGAGPTVRLFGRGRPNGWFGPVHQQHE
jgi:hypothetical protein